MDMKPEIWTVGRTNVKHQTNIPLPSAGDNKTWANSRDSGAEVIKLISCSTQLSVKSILLIIVKMPTIFGIVGILTFISMMNANNSKSLKAKKVFIHVFQHFSIYEQLKFHAQLR